MKRYRTMWIFLLMFSVLQAFGAEADFTVSVPNGWVKKDKTTALAQYQKGPGSLIITADYMPSVCKTPDQYIDYVKTQLSKTFKSITYESVVKGKKDGLETRELFYTIDLSGMKMKYDVFYVFKNSKAYTLTTANMLDLFDAGFAADLKAIFSSFKLK